MENLLVGNNSGPKIIVKVKDITIGEKEKVIISGPCSVENYNTMKEIGKELKDMGVHILRGGAFKPRTSPYDFQGLKYEGVKILHEVGKEFNMPIVTEIMDARDIEKCIDYIDMIQVGSRNMYNYTLLKELGKCNLPILLKRGMSATITEWLNAAEYIMSSRNTLDLNSVAVIKEKCRIPIVVDPSHGTGRRELVERMAIASIASGADGVMIESHIEPDRAISDSKQTVSMDIMKSIVSKVNELKNIF